MHQPVVFRRPDVMSGTPVFAGTRVPVQTLIEYLSRPVNRSTNFSPAFRL
jgi:uncharacterized protein (DUF433 family)